MSQDSGDCFENLVYLQQRIVYHEGGMINTSPSQPSIKYIKYYFNDPSTCRTLAA